MKLFINHFLTSTFEELLQAYKHVDFSLFVDARPTNSSDLSPINILVLQEPNEYFGHHDWAIKNKNLFSIIYTWSDKVLNNCENAVFLTFGTTWITNEQASKCPPKEFSLAHLCGQKLLTYGHHIRHEIFNRQNEITIPKKFLFHREPPPNLPDNMPFHRETKMSVFDTPMFAIVIENTSHNGYFTEKINDCMLLKSIPLYWGCSNIGDFYDTSGIIFFKNADELIKIVNRLTPEYYYDRLNIIESNHKKVALYQRYENRISEKIAELFRLNNITS
jgi:hypothetical protein